jgi:hypothetical protein
LKNISTNGPGNCRSLGFAPNEQNDFSISIRYWEGETADSSASLGMTKGRTALSLNLVVPPTIPMDVVHFSLYLPQASRGARDDKGEDGAPMESSCWTEGVFHHHGEPQAHDHSVENECPQWLLKPLKSC